MKPTAELVDDVRAAAKLTSLASSARDAVWQNPTAHEVMRYQRWVREAALAGDEDGALMRLHAAMGTLRIRLDGGP